jgi:hypothetical protein
MVEFALHFLSKSRDKLKNVASWTLDGRGPHKATSLKVEIVGRAFTARLARRKAAPYV